MGRSLGQILVVLVVLVVLVNIPISYYGTGLAQIVPNTTGTVIHDGMLLKGSGPEIYVLENYKLRRISSPVSLRLFFSSNTPQIVEDSLLEQFGKGQPIRRLVKCQDSPYVYALEDGHKRRVKDLPTHNSTKPWDQVYLVSCVYLRNLPEGLPILEETDLLP